MNPNNRPLYTIGIASELLGVHPRTLRIYEQRGLLKPARRGGQRFFSNADLQRVRCIRELIHSEGLNIEGIARLLALVPCWDIKGCSEEERAACNAQLARPAPCWDAKARVCINGDAQMTCQDCSVYLRGSKRKSVLEKMSQPFKPE